MHAFFAASAQRRADGRVWLAMTVLAFVGATPRSALGHGNPVLVQGGEETLGIGWGLTDVRGYARQVFADIDEDAGLSPAPGNRYATTLPGFDLQDLQAGDDLWIEAFARPFTAEGRVENRWLWHWQASTGGIAELPADANLQLASSRGFLPSVFLAQDVAPQHTSVQLADVLPTDVNQHRHLITYVVSNPALAAGDVYAFFGRLHAPGYAPSEPLLIAVQSGLGAAEFQAAARQINAAALLPGDFDHNDAVDGVDLLVWQRAFASVGEHPADMNGDGAVEGGDLALWAAFLGRRWPADVGAVTTIPEAATGPLALLATLLGGRTRGARHRRARTAPRAFAPDRSFWRPRDSSRVTRPPAIGWPVTY